MEKPDGAQGPGPATAPVEAAVVCAVGPGEREVERVADLLASVWAWEPAATTVVLVDDAPRPRALATRLAAPPGRRLAAVGNPRAGRGNGGYDGLAAGVLTALRWVHDNTQAAFALKLDTDSLVIGPFAAAIAGAFAARPDVGVLGSHEVTCNGTPRDVSSWARLVTMLSHRAGVSLRRAPVRQVHLALWGARARVRKAIRAALAAGYRPGEHCQGGGYAVSLEALRRLAHDGHLSDPTQWLHTGLGEDVVVALVVRATGLRLGGLAGDGLPFGVSFSGLADTPERLVARGFSVIHSLKNDPRVDEARVREFFRARRPAARG